MADPIQFPSTTSRFGLPLLHVAQAQKELFVNEAHTLTDALLHVVVKGEVTTPPADHSDGDAYLIGQGPTDLFAGREDQIAVRQQEQWLFVTPVPGMRVFDSVLGASRIYDDGWSTPAEVAAPVGGSITDLEARAAIGEILSLMRGARLLPSG